MSQMIFINPKSGALNGFTEPGEIKARLARFGMEPEITLGSNARAMTAFITKAKRQKPTAVLVAGGDGTFSTIAKGLIGQNITLGLIPTGSVNNIGQSIGLTGDIDQALKTIQKGATAPFDVGRVGKHYFIEGTGIGLIARIFDQTDWDKEKKKVQMVTTTLREVVTAKPTKVEMEVDGKIYVFETVWLTITNTGRMGAINLGPNSQPGDGTMELIYCKPLSLLEIPKYAASFLKSNHLEQDKFEMVRFKKVRLKLPGNIRMHVDDISTRAGQMTIEVIPGAFQIYTTRPAKLTKGKA